MIKTKTILKDKFWILEDQGVRVGTLSIADDKFMFSGPAGTKYFDSENALKKTFGKGVMMNEVPVQAEVSTQKEAYGYPTSTTPYNPMLDVQRKLPLFTKSKKSKSLYAAGYYIIHFDKGWVRSFCPKLVTLEKYDYRGPFKTEFTMRQELSDANKRTN